MCVRYTNIINNNLYMIKLTKNVCFYDYYLLYIDHESVRVFGSSYAGDVLLPIMILMYNWEPLLNVHLIRKLLLSII